jgi:hypothetical protein
LKKMGPVGAFMVSWMVQETGVGSPQVDGPHLSSRDLHDATVLSMTQGEVSGGG